MLDFIMENDTLSIFLSSPDCYGLRVLVIVLLGICVGSFLNVIALRSLKEESWLVKPSYCPKCEHKLGILDLIPVISYVIQGAKCRYCKESISWQYPVVEILTGFAFFAVFATFGITIHGIAMAYFSAILIAICITDFREKLIPHEITYPAMLIGIFYRSFFVIPKETISFLEPEAIRPDIPQNLSFVAAYTGETLNAFSFHPELFFNTLTGIGISYIVFDYIDFYGLVLLRFIQGDLEDEEKEEEDDLLDLEFDIKEEPYDEEQNIVMGGGDAVLSAVIAAWLGLKGMMISVLLAFLIGSIMGAVYLFVDMKRRHVLHTVKKPALIGFLCGAGLLSLPLLAFGMISGNLEMLLTPQLGTLSLTGGIAGGLISAIFSGSRFQARFPFGPSLAIGALFAMFIDVLGGLTGLLGGVSQPPPF